MNLRQKLTTALLTAVACFLLLPTAAADNVILDDLIVDGSACIGLDCVNGESFGFDTLRLKENNLRIRFFDTSASASFPSRDWEITANESENGGANKFSITDIDGGKVPFTIEANAPNNALYVDDGGRMGFGTKTPVVEMHVVNGDTPTLRLEQDGSSGFQPQTWDVAGNESNFFVRDVTNGSKLPFKIVPNAPTNSLYVAADGDVGLGTASPANQLVVSDTGVVLTDVVSSDNGAVQHRLITNGGVGSRRFVGLSDSSTVQSQVILDDNQVRIAGTNDGANLFATFNSSGLTLEALCGVNGGAPAADACDAVFSPEYEVESIEEHAEFMWENSHLPAIGPTPEGERINISVQQRHFGVLNELEKAHIYIERLNERLKEKASQVDDLTERLARLEALVVADERNND